MKVVCIADTHEMHRRIRLPKGDLLIHAGDFTWVGKEEPTLDFLGWFETQPFDYKIFLSGNHDFYFEHGRNTRHIRQRDFNYLVNESVTINRRFNIWGSPFTPEFMNWAFMKTPSEIERVWNQIPDGLDILITHGPPFGILDQTQAGFHAGCPKLLEAVQFKRPKIHIFGHIHEGYGRLETKGTTFINASLCNANYALVNQPIVVDLE